MLSSAKRTTDEATAMTVDCGRVVGPIPDKGLVPGAVPPSDVVAESTAEIVLIVSLDHC